MVIIVKKLVPIYSEKDNVAKQYLNLRKAVYVTTFKHLYPNITDILVKEYGLTLTEKIVVFWTKEISLRRFNRFRVKFRKVYSGPLIKFREHTERFRKQGLPERKWR